MHIKIQKCQVLLLNKGGTKGKELAEKSDVEAMKTLNVALGKIGGGDDRKFVAVSKLRNSNHLLTEMNTSEAATWLRNISASTRFMLEMGDAIKIASHDNEIIIHFIPVNFDPTDNYKL